MLSVKSKFDSLPFDGFLSFLTNDAFQDNSGILKTNSKNNHTAIS